MALQPALHAALVFGPVVLLLLVGLVVTARSGVMQVGSGKALRRVAENLSQLALALAVCFACLAVLQHMVGFHLALVW